MPEPFALTVGIAGIILIGLAFTAINLVKDAGRLIALALLAFLAVILLNRTMSPSNNFTYPNSSGSNSVPNSSNSPGFPNSSNSPDFSNPSVAPTYPGVPNSSTSPTQRPRSSFDFDSASKGISDFAKSVSRGIDEFVYGNPYAVEPSPSEIEPGVEPGSTQTRSVPPEQQGYQIRPDGVPSRVSTLVEPDAPGRTGGAAGSSGAAGRPVSAWW
ncbi:MAG TPA: hypothetical protein V6C84_23490 [Coleofasciculaceae cyanobacterium]|jgi:hypothetical protein